MNALTASRPLDNALLPDFDSEASWTRLQSAYLNCPKVERGAV